MARKARRHMRGKKINPAPRVIVLYRGPRDRADILTTVDTNRAKIILCERRSTTDDARVPCMELSEGQHTFWFIRVTCFLFRSSRQYAAYSTSGNVQFYSPFRPTCNGQKSIGIQAKISVIFATTNRKKAK